MDQPVKSVAAVLLAVIIAGGGLYYFFSRNLSLPPAQTAQTIEALPVVTVQQTFLEYLRSLFFGRSSIVAPPPPTYQTQANPRAGAGRGTPAETPPPDSPEACNTASRLAGGESSLYAYYTGSKKCSGWLGNVPDCQMEIPPISRYETMTPHSEWPYYDELTFSSACRSYYQEVFNWGLQQNAGFAVAKTDGGRLTDPDVPPPDPLNPNGFPKLFNKVKIAQCPRSNQPIGEIEIICLKPPGVLDLQYTNQLVGVYSDAVFEYVCRPGDSPQPGQGFNQLANICGGRRPTSASAYCGAWPLHRCQIDNIPPHE